jgi:hypothetical protein
MILATTLETVPGTVREVVRKAFLDAMSMAIREEVLTVTMGASRTPTYGGTGVAVLTAIRSSTGRAIGKSVVMATCRGTVSVVCGGVSKVTL